MAKASLTTNQEVFYSWIIWCPGCDKIHSMNAGWIFNDNYDHPTFNPSILVRGVTGLESEGTMKKTICHSFVTDGKIRFLDDCTHRLKGQTVDLPDEFNVDFDPEDYTKIVESKMKQ